MFRPIGKGKVLGRDRREGVGLCSSIRIKSYSLELRMAHLFIQKYMNNSLILNIQIVETYFFPDAIYFLTSLKNKSFLFLVTKNSIFVVGKLEKIVLILFLLVFLILSILFGLFDLKHKTYYLTIQEEAVHWSVCKYIKIEPFNRRISCSFKIFSFPKSGIVCALKLEFETALIAFYWTLLIFLNFLFLEAPRHVIPNSLWILTSVLRVVNQGVILQFQKIFSSQSSPIKPC